MNVLLGHPQLHRLPACRILNRFRDLADAFRSGCCDRKDRRGLAFGFVDLLLFASLRRFNSLLLVALCFVNDRIACAFGIHTGALFALNPLDAAAGVLPAGSVIDIVNAPGSAAQFGGADGIHADFLQGLGYFAHQVVHLPLGHVAMEALEQGLVEQEHRDHRNGHEHQTLIHEGEVQPQHCQQTDQDGARAAKQEQSAARHGLQGEQYQAQINHAHQLTGGG
jgi:hypothetical protein